MLIAVKNKFIVLFILIFSTLSFPIVQSRIYIVIKIHKLQHNTPCSKKGHETHGSSSLSSQPIFDFFTSDSPENLQQFFVKDLTALHMRRYTIL